MGFICEFYRVEDKIIDQFIGNPKEFERYFYDSYVNPFGEFHREGDNFFYTDKAWDIAMYLLKSNDSSKDKILDKIEGTEVSKYADGFSYIKSQDVKSINNEMRNITIDQVLEVYDDEKMIEDGIYRAGWFTKSDNLDYILDHVKTIQEAFQKSSENNDGILILKG